MTQRVRFDGSTPRASLPLRLAILVDAICDRLEDDDPEPVVPSPDPITVARRVDALCVRFEDAWRQGKAPWIEGFLPERRDPARPVALRELVELERELRAAAGEPPSLSEYRIRFADEFEALAQVFDDGEPSAGSRISPRAASELLSGTRVGDYELVEEIGRGGMGVVYRARHVVVGRAVALKMILSGEFASDSETRRFRAEAEAAANLDHPNIVPILEVGEHLGRPYYTMRLLPGGSLRPRLRESRISPKGAARLLSTVARAMHHAHRRGFVHRDLKPANILFDEAGKPFITDFGLAKRLDRAGQTGLGALLGTPGYMSPEQAAGRTDITASADIYSLGVVLYELLAGRAPFRAATEMETLVLVMEGEPLQPRQINPAVPSDLEFICLRCMEKDPSRRYPSAAALADDLDRYLLGEVVEGRRGKMIEAVIRKARREPVLATRMGALSLLSFFVQTKFVLSGFQNKTSHLLVTALLGVWAISTLLFQLALRRDWRGNAVKIGWIATEVVLTTAILRIRDNTVSSGVIVYPLLIAAAGLWSRIELVWWTTGIAMVAYFGLMVESFLRKGMSGPDNNETIILGVLMVMGFVVAKHVKRVLAISSYYEHRANR
jgi:serine/threonine-protein kinase